MSTTRLLKYMKTCGLNLVKIKGAQLDQLAQSDCSLNPDQK